MRVRVAAEAEEELSEAAAWYEARRAGLGLELIAVIDGELERIAAAPLGHPVWRADRPYRLRVVRRFPYVIFFRAEANEVVIIAVSHARRRPGYWASR